MEGTRLYSIDYLMRGSVSPEALGQFMTQIISHDPEPQLAITNLTVGVFESCTFQNGEWSKTFHGSHMAEGRVSDEDSGWQAVEQETASVVFSSIHAADFTAEKVIFPEGHLVIRGLTIAAPSRKTLQIDEQKIQTSLTLTEQPEGGYITRASLYHIDHGLQRPEVPPVPASKPALAIVA